MENYGKERMEHQPHEIIEEYRHPMPQEVVEVYSRPLPWLKQDAPAKKTHRKLGIWIFLACLLVTIVLALCAWLVADHDNGDAATTNDGFSWHYGMNWEDYEQESQEITIPSWEAEPGIRLDVTREHGEVLTIQEIYQQVNPAVVAIIGEQENKYSFGTGVIFTADGYILTNYHVIEGAKDCLVALSTGYSCEAKYVAGDAESDLAILKVDEVDLPAAEFGESDDLTVGDPAYAIGNPMGVELRGTLTDGIISAINRDVWMGGRNMTLLQTNAALNTGNSGGPLINQYGQVVGINVIKMYSEETVVEGLGFAIPSAAIDRIVNDLLTYGEVKPEPLFGITVLTIAEEAEEGVWGLVVQSVVPDGAGDRAGVQAGDYVLSANGEPVSTSADLLRVRRHLYVGDTLELLLWRDGEEIPVTLDLQQAVESETED